MTGFNPLFAGLTLKAAKSAEEAVALASFNPLFAGLTLKDMKDIIIAAIVDSFNPLFAGLTLKGMMSSPTRGRKAVSIPYLRG